MHAEREMLKLEGHVLGALRAVYRDSVCRTNAKGQWGGRGEGLRFLRPAECACWALLIDRRVAKFDAPWPQCIFTNHVVCSGAEATGCSPRVGAAASSW